MISDEDHISATIVACRRCGRRYYCNPRGNCWCMATVSASDDPDEPSGADCLCPDCLTEREA